MDASEADEAWRKVVDPPASAWWKNDPVASAAYQHPVLRKLFPSFSHGMMMFYRNRPPRWPVAPAEELPLIICGGPPFKVMSAGYGPMIGEGNSAEEAVMILVANLPDDLTSVGSTP